MANEKTRLSGECLMGRWAEVPDGDSSACRRKVNASRWAQPHDVVWPRRRSAVCASAVPPHAHAQFQRRRDFPFDAM